MDSKTTINTLKIALNDLIKENNKSEAFKHISSEFYMMDTDPDIVEEIITELNIGLGFHDNNQEVIDFLDSLYLGEDDKAKPTSGLHGLNQMLTQQYDKKTALDCNREVSKALAYYDERKNFKYKIGTSKFVVLNKREGRIIKQYYRNIHGQDIATWDSVVNAYPIEIIIHDSPLSDEGRTFSIKWSSNKGQNYFENNHCTIKEIEESLEAHGYVQSPGLLKGTIASVLQLAMDEGIAIIRSEVDTPGFYYDKKDEHMVVVDYDKQPVNIKKLKMSLDIIEEFKPFFEGHETKIAHAIKWGMVAPFSYMKKQMGLGLDKLVPNLYLYGKAGSGKTSLAMITLFMWGLDIKARDKAGTDFDTVPKVGKQLSASTFPLIFNEPQGAFGNKFVVEAIKTSVERTVSRSRHEGTGYKSFMALSPCIFPSNHSIPNDDGLLRRHDVLIFNFSERKNDDEKKAFEEHFLMDNPKLSKLNQLSELGSFVLNELYEDVRLLEIPWKELTNSLLLRAYADCDRSCPDWLLEFHKSTTLEDLDEEEAEEIRMFLLDEVNKKSRQIQLVTEDGRRDNSLFTDAPVLDGTDFTTRVRDVINQRLIPWLFLYRKKNNKEYVCFTAGMKKDLASFTSVCYPVTSVAELLGWKYGSIRLSNDKVIKGMSVEFDEFINFIYPVFDENINFENIGDEIKEVSED